MNPARLIRVTKYTSSTSPPERWTPASRRWRSRPTTTTPSVSRRPLLHCSRPSRRRLDHPRRAWAGARRHRGRRGLLLLRVHFVDTLTRGGRIDYLICDEAQFYAPTRSTSSPDRRRAQIDVFAFGILSDFRSTCSPAGPGSSSSPTDDVLQVEALCWCGKRATHNARTENGEMVIEGEVIVVGDVDTDDPPLTWPTRCSAASTSAAG